MRKLLLLFVSSVAFPAYFPGVNGTIQNGIQKFDYDYGTVLKEKKDPWLTQCIKYKGGNAECSVLNTKTNFYARELFLYGNEALEAFDQMEKIFSTDIRIQI